MWLTYREAADRLGVRRDTLKMAGLARRVVVKNGRISEEEVEKWLKMFLHLHGEFDWLWPDAKRSLDSIRTFEAPLVVLILDCSEKTLRLWAKDGLLPYFIRSLTNSAWGRCEYAADYISGLCRFAGEDKVTKVLVQEYQRLCSANKRVM